MKIGLITGEYPPLQGGVGDFTRELAQAMIALGHEVHVITGRQASNPLEAVNTKLKEDGIVAHRSITTWGFGCRAQIAKIARENFLEILNIQYEPAAYAGQGGINFLPNRFVRPSRQLPIVTTFHDLLVPYLFPKAGPLRRKMVDYLARKSDAVIVTNEEDRSKLHFPTSHLSLIPIGSNIDPKRLIDFDLPAARAKWRIQADELVIGYFGFLSASKGGEVLIRALKLLADQNLPVKLLLIGGRTGASDPSNAIYAAQVDRLIESSGLKERVIETGYLDSLEVSRALMACDIVALPYQDGASLRRGSLLAAIAHHRAIVTTAPRFPIHGLIANQSLLFVPPDDPAALARAIGLVLTDRVLRQQLEHGAGEAALFYTWDRIAAQTIEVYQSVLS